MLLILGLVLVACSVVMYVRAANFSRRRATEVVADISQYGYEPPADSDAARMRVLPQLDAFAATLGSSFIARFGGGAEQEMQNLLRSAGIYRLSPRKLLGYRLLAAVALPAVWLLLASGQGGVILVIGFFIAIALGWQGPIVYLRRLARTRLEEIDFQMPELIDVLVTTVEAGVGFAGSLQLAAQRLTGVL